MKKERELKQNVGIKLQKFLLLIIHLKYFIFKQNYNIWKKVKNNWYWKSERKILWFIIRMI